MIERTPVRSPSQTIGNNHPVQHARALSLIGNAIERTGFFFLRPVIHTADPKAPIRPHFAVIEPVHRTIGFRPYQQIQRLCFRIEPVNTVTQGNRNTAVLAHAETADLAGHRPLFQRTADRIEPEQGRRKNIDKIKRFFFGGPIKAFTEFQRRFDFENQFRLYHCRCHAQGPIKLRYSHFSNTPPEKAQMSAHFSIAPNRPLFYH